MTLIKAIVIITKRITNGGKKMQLTKTKNIILGGLMIALVFISTFSVRIPVPFTQGYIHAGDSMIFIAAILLGWKYGALAGGIGSALADIVGGYAMWALPTFIIKAIMGGLVGWLAGNKTKKSSTIKTLTGLFSACVWFGFTYILRGLLTSKVLQYPQIFIGEIEGVTSLQELMLLTQKVQGQLLLISIAIPLILLALSIIIKKRNTPLFSISQLLGMLVAGLWMVSGYYFTASLMYGSYVVPIFSLPWDILQFTIGLAIAFALLLALGNTQIIRDLNK